jgi:hypothetical protein
MKPKLVACERSLSDESDRMRIKSRFHIRGMHYTNAIKIGKHINVRA